jgi:hypothetical protein
VKSPASSDDQIVGLTLSEFKLHNTQMTKITAVLLVLPKHLLAKNNKRVRMLWNWIYFVRPHYHPGFGNELSNATETKGYVA